MANLKDYLIVTAAYWTFTLTDGALRMLVLLHFYSLGYTPIQLAFLFVFYELMGVITNLIGGWLASQLGLKYTLYGGLTLQIIALLALSGLNQNWSTSFAIIYVFCVQGLSGIAKDLSKMSAKSAIKLLVPENSHTILFKWVAILTGSKNTLKGFGFFLGGISLVYLGFPKSLWFMATSLLIILLLTIYFLSPNINGRFLKTKITSILSKSTPINLLSLARAFLFGSRDVWFVVGLPIFLHDALNWGFQEVGGFFALWIIAYGVIQALTPNILRVSELNHINYVNSLISSTFGLCGVTLILSLALSQTFNPTIFLFGGLSLFAVFFAINSSLHSFLILTLTKKNRVALDVGFYYMANAAGRLIGTFLSGIAYQYGGLLGCLIGATIMIICSSFCVIFLKRKLIEK